MDTKLLEKEKFLLLYNCRIPSTDVDKKFDEEAINAKDTVAIDGFRKGSAPIDEVKKKYKDKLGEIAVEKVVRENVNELTKDLLLESHPSVDFDDGNSKYGSDIVFKLSLELQPSMPEIKYNKIKFDTVEYDVSDDEVNSEINNLLSQKAQFIKSDKKVVGLEDYVILTVNCFINDQKVQSFSGENVMIFMGAPDIIPGFNNNIIGKNIGDKFNFTLSIPDTVTDESIRGKDGSFEMELISVMDKKVPELTEELAKEFKFESIEDMKKKTFDVIKNFKKDVLDSLLRPLLFDKLAVEYDFDVQDKLIKKEFDSLMSMYKSNKKYENMSEKDLTKKVNNAAKKRLRLYYLRNKIIRDEKITVEDGDALAELSREAFLKRVSISDLVKFYQGNNDALAALRERVFDNKVFNVLYERCNKKMQKVDNDGFNSFIESLRKDINELE